MQAYVYMQTYTYDPKKIFKRLNNCSYQTTTTPEENSFEV